MKQKILHFEDRVRIPLVFMTVPRFARKESANTQSVDTGEYSTLKANNGGWKHRWSNVTNLTWRLF
jgi:hypothetical protein